MSVELDRVRFDLVSRSDKLDKLDFRCVSAMDGRLVGLSFADELLFSENVLGLREKATILCSCWYIVQ